jgi:hypothetical protein
MRNKTQNDKISINPFAVGDAKKVNEIATEVSDNPTFWSEQAAKLKCILDDGNLTVDNTSKEQVLDVLELEQDRVWKLSSVKNVNIKDICPHNIYEDRNSGVYRCLVCNSDELTKQDLCKS